MIPSFVDNVSTNSYQGIVVDRFLLSQTWYNLLTKLAGKHPGIIEQMMIDTAYKKIVERMEQMTDEELMDDMCDILDHIEIAKVGLPGLVNKGYYKK